MVSLYAFDVQLHLSCWFNVFQCHICYPLSLTFRDER